VKIDDWEEISKNVVIVYRKDNQFSELKDLEILNNRLSALQQIDQYVGKYFSKAFVRKNVLRLSEEEIAELEKEIEQEPAPEEGTPNE
jgi:Ran GTPase-activating protein (RanGAP) involved in mRNA processing and transport